MTPLERAVIEAAIAYHDRIRTLDWAMHSEWDRLKAAIEAYRAQVGVGDVAERIEGATT